MTKLLIAKERDGLVFHGILDGAYVSEAIMWTSSTTGPQLGWICYKPGQGLMTETVKEVLPLVPEAFQRAIIWEGNYASRRVAEKCGFRLSGLCWEQDWGLQLEYVRAP